MADPQAVPGRISVVNVRLGGGTARHETYVPRTIWWHLCRNHTVPITCDRSRCCPKCHRARAIKDADGHVKVLPLP